MGIKKLIVLLMLVQPMFAWAESHGTDAAKNNNEKKSVTEITVSPLQAVKMAGDFVYQGKYDSALQILTKMPQTNNLPVEIERWYLLAQIEQRKGNIDEAIKIYRKILDDQPDLVKIRYELALCYMQKKQWYRADYHLRLAMAGENLPDDVKRVMVYNRYVVRQNKNWDVWFNFGATPDSNINQVAGGDECITNEYGSFCRPLPEPVSAVGYNANVGGNYEFKFGEHWRWKSDANLYTSVYREHDYDDFYFGMSTGPRYVWRDGDIWVANIASRRLYGWHGYNWSYGGKVDFNYDLSRRWTTGLTFAFLDNVYDEYAEYMNGETYTINSRLAYSFDASKYIILRSGATREDTNNKIYQNWRYNVALGFGAELPWGFYVYVEPWFSWANYDGERWAVRDARFVQITEHDFTQSYSLSLSNNKISIWVFVQMITFNYARRDSNIKNRGYNKTSLEFHLRQRF